MQFSHLLSDLSSLSEPLCDHDAAIKLLSVDKTTPSDPSTQSASEHAGTTAATDDDDTRTAAASSPQSSQDVDLKRADDLVSLHYDVKVKYAEGGSLGGQVIAARQSVGGVLRALSRGA